MQVADPNVVLALENGVWEAVDENPKLALAFENAITATANYLDAIKRFNAKPGFWANARQNRRLFDTRHFMELFIQAYQVHAGQALDEREKDRVMLMIKDAAEIMLDSTYVMREMFNKFNQR